MNGHGLRRLAGDIENRDQRDRPDHGASSSNSTAVKRTADAEASAVPFDQKSHDLQSNRSTQVAAKSGSPKFPRSTSGENMQSGRSRW